MRLSLMLIGDIPWSTLNIVPNRNQTIHKVRKSVELFQRLLKALHGKQYLRLMISDAGKKQLIVCNLLCEKSILDSQEMFILMDQSMVEILVERSSEFELPRAVASFRNCVESIPLYPEVMSA